MKKLMMLALACAALACAAEDTRIQKIIPVTRGETGQIFQTVRDLMGSTGLVVKTYQNNVVLSGSPEAVAAAEQLIKNLENAAPRQRTIEVTGYIVLALTQSGETNMPADLDPVLKQFRSLLNYKSFRVLDTIILRGKEMSSMSSGGFLALPGAAGARADLNVGRPTVTDDGIRLHDLNLSVRIPTTRVNEKNNLIYDDAHIATDADVKAGQKVAIGKASVDANGDALILVVSAKVVD